MNTSLIIVAIIGFFGQIAAQIIASLLAQANSRRAEISASKARAAAKEAALIASLTSESNAAQIQKLRSLAQGTHMLVNSQRTALLKLNAELAHRIADENPNDRNAQAAAGSADEQVMRANESDASLASPQKT